MEEEVMMGVVSKQVAVIACTAMALLYVGILYAPTLILRLPPASSYKHFLIRRFKCAAISSTLSVFICALILPITSWEASNLLQVYSIRLSNIWQAVVFPLFLTSLMYAGSLVAKSMLLLDSWKEHTNHNGGFSFDFVKDIFGEFQDWIYATAADVLTWRNYVVAPLTEELVFRACMIPLLLCGGFGIYTVIFLCPVFFSLAHLNHWMELYHQQKYSFLKASMIAGLQLGYTVIFGSYASFLFIRTGNLASSLVAHIFCNFMGLPLLFSRRTSFVTVAFVGGMVSFIWLLFPITRPDLYNDRTNNCRCWHGYCSWN